MKTWTETPTLAALAVLFTLPLAGCAEDGPGNDPLTGAPEEGHVQQADNAQAYARALALGCSIAEGGAVRCPKLALLGGNTYFRSVEDMPPPRAPLSKRFPQDLLLVARRALENPDHPDHAHFKNNRALVQYILEIEEAEEAMARAGCATVEDACANRVRASLGWVGMEPPGATDYRIKRTARRATEMRERSPK